MPTQFAAQLTMAKISIKRRKDFERADGRAPLYAVFNIKGEKIRIPVEIAVTAAEWDEDAEQIRGRSSDVKDKNLIISKKLFKFDSIKFLWQPNQSFLQRPRLILHNCEKGDGTSQAMRKFSRPPI